MANECLVTKLKGIVIDADKKLEPLGGVVVQLKPAAAGTINRFLNLSNLGSAINGEVKFEFIDKDAYFVVGQNNSAFASWSITAGSGDLYWTSGSVNPVRLFISSSSPSLLRIDSLYAVDVDKLLLYQPSLVNIYNSALSEYVKFHSENGVLNSFERFNISCNNSDVDIDLAHLSSANFQNFSAEIKDNRTAVHGSIVNFGASVRMTGLNLYAMRGISGTLQELAAAQVAAGRTSGSLLCLLGGSSITIDGTTPVGDTNRITFDGGSPGYVIS